MINQSSELAEVIAEIDSIDQEIEAVDREIQDLKDSLSRKQAEIEAIAKATLDKYPLL